MTKNRMSREVLSKNNLNISAVTESTTQRGRHILHLPTECHLFVPPPPARGEVAVH